MATGITMEFAFGTNWATYSRFVGDIFGAPLAAEGLFAFFLESTFLAVLLFGRNRVSKKFFYVSTWLVWCGSLLSALWIIIANSWMQTPAGYQIVETTNGTKAEMTGFFAAALNPSMVPRYVHTVDALLMAGGFTAIAIAAYHLRKGTHLDFARKTMKTGILVAGDHHRLMLPAGHGQAVNVVENQPSKIAAMEGHWDDGPIPLGLIGWVKADGRDTTAIEIPGGVNLLTGDFSRTKSFPGLNSFAPEDRPPVNLTYQTYHWMTLLWGAMLMIVVVLWFMNRSGALEKRRGAHVADVDTRTPDARDPAGLGGGRGRTPAMDRLGRVAHARCDLEGSACWRGGDHPRALRRVLHRDLHRMGPSRGAHDPQGTRWGLGRQRRTRAGSGAERRACRCRFGLLGH